MAEWLKMRVFSPRLILAILILIRAVTMIVLSHETSMTIDESKNFQSAERAFLEHKLDRIKDSEMPITVLNAAFKALLEKPRIRDGLERFGYLDQKFKERAGSIAFNQAIIPLSYAVAFELGAASSVALAFAAVLAFEPSILHHSILVTVDGAMATFFLLLLWTGLRWTRNPSLARLAAFGLTLGLLQGVKFSAAYAVPLAMIWVFFLARGRGLRAWLKAAGCFSISALLGLWLIFGFNHLGQPIGQILFQSPVFHALQARLAAIPTPFPVDYLRGLDWVYSIERGPRNVFIRGVHYPNGVWYYFLYTILLKTPIPLLVLALAGWVTRLRKGVDPGTGLILWLFIPLFLYFSLIFRNQIGIRYILPIYPFFLLGLIWFRGSRLTVALAGAWYSLSVAAQWPNYIGYFNELVPVEHHRWWHLGDSNLSWEHEREAWIKHTLNDGIAQTQIGPRVLLLEDPFYLDAMVFSGIFGESSGNESFVGKVTEPIGSFRGIWLKFALTPAQVIANTEGIKFPGRPLSGPVAIPGCRDQTLNLTHGYTGPNDHDRNLTGAIAVPWRGDVWLQLYSSVRADVRLGGHSILLSEPEIYPGYQGPVRQVSWKSVRLRLEAGVYPIQIALKGGRIPELWFSVHDLSLDGLPLARALPIPICNLTPVELHDRRSRSALAQP